MSQVHPMLEKVARAMCVQDGLDPDEQIIGGQASGFQDYGPLWQAERASDGQLGITDYLGLARAAVRALMEPDESQLAGGRNADVVCESMRDEYRAIFRGMLLPLVGGAGRDDTVTRQPTPGVYGPDQARVPGGEG